MAKTALPQYKSLLGKKHSVLEPIKAAGRARKAGKVVKSKKPEKLGRDKIKQRHEHELADMFSANIEQSRNRILESTGPSYEPVYNTLSRDLAGVSGVFENLEDSIANLTFDFKTPFKDEELSWVSADGKQTGIVTLSNRMRKLQKAIDAEQDELQRQWDEWVEAENEIEDLASEFADMTYDDNIQRITLEDVQNAEERELMEEIEAEKARFKKMIESVGKTSVKSMEDSEKAGPS